MVIADVDAYYDPVTSLLFEDFDSTTLKAIQAALLIDLRTDFVLDPETAHELFLRYRTHIHETAHYAQHATTSYGLLMRRLYNLRTYAGAFVMDAYLSATGQLTTIPKLVALNLADNVVPMRHLTERGISDMAQALLLRWNACDEIIGALTSSNFPTSYVEMHWNVVREVLAQPTLIPGSEPVLIDFANSKTSPTGRTAHDQFVTVRDLLEGGARWRDLFAASRTMLRGGAMDYWLNDRGMRSLLMCTQRLGVSPFHSIIPLLHDLPLMCCAPPEMLMGLPSFDWQLFHPGLVFEAWLDNLTGVAIPHNMATPHAYHLLLEHAPTGLANYLGRTLRYGEHLDAVEHSLAQRDEFASVGAYDAPAHRFADLTYRAAFKIRYEAGHVFCSQPEELRDESVALVRRISQPPLAVTPSAIDTYPVVTADRLEHLPLVVSAMHIFALWQVQNRGAVDGCNKLFATVGFSYAESDLRGLIMGLWNGLMQKFPTLKTVFPLDALLEGNQ